MQNNSASSGFTAGTLVHTKDGLVPIEKIKVGDLVLSRAENMAVGVAPAPKRVLKTIAYEAMEIKFVGYKNGRNLEDRTYPLFASIKQPFWVKNKGWVETHLLEGDWLGPSLLVLLNDVIVYCDPIRIFKSNEDSVGWIAYNGFEGKGSTWNFIENVWGKNVYFDILNWPIHEAIDGGDGDGYRYTATVYNLEVEDFHSYFVGEHGVLVKSA